MGDRAEITTWEPSGSTHLQGPHSACFLGALLPILGTRGYSSSWSHRQSGRGP